MNIMSKHLATALLLLTAFASQTTAQYYTTYTTTADGLRLMDYATGEANTTGGTLLTMQKNTRYQTMEGFGYAITYSVCYNLMQMHPRDRHAFLSRTFSPHSGYGVSYVRISIGCSDFSSTEYTLCDTQGLNNFRLHSDEVDYVVPILQEILAINPDVKIIGAPWTCPRWMKVKDLSSMSAHNSWTGGHLNPAYYDLYAQYFVRFIQTMAELGIPIYAVTPQNEPLSGGNCASLVMFCDEQAAFINRLAPAFHRAGLSTKIYVFDHNFNYDGISAQEDYPVKVYEALDPNMEGAELVVGSAWHSYGGSPSELDDIRAKAPNKDLIFTEASIGTWNDGRNLAARLISDFSWGVYGTVSRYCSAYIVWNLMLDLRRGPNLSGGCTTCYGAVDIDHNDYHTITANSQYYMINHMSAVVKPGAVRIGYRTTLTGLQIMCFQNPDDSYGVVFTNEGSSDKNVTVMASGIGYATTTVPAKSLVSMLLTQEKLEPDMLIGTTPMQRQSLGKYSLTMDLEQNQTLTTSFLGEDLSQWYVDPDFLGVSSDGSIQLRALSGTYTLVADLNERSLLVEPRYELLNADGQGNLYIIGATRSQGKPYFVSGSDWSLERAIPMAEVSDGIYQATLTVGQQLAPSDIEFGIYGSNEQWTPQFMGRSGSTYRLTCNNLTFGIGTGLMSWNDGTIYKRSSTPLVEGHTYRFTVDLTRGVASGVLTVERVETTGVYAIPASDSAGSVEAVYDLGGRRLGEPRPGVNIVNGRKELQQR